MHPVLRLTLAITIGGIALPSMAEECILDKDIKLPRPVRRALRT